jgi:hypothetical protein
LKALNRESSFEELSIDGGVILKFIINEYGKRVWAGFIWPAVGTGGRLL